MKASAARTGLQRKTAPLSPRVRGFLHIARHGFGPAAIYTMVFHRLDREGPAPKPLLVEGAHALIEMLERIGVDFGKTEVRGALEDILRLGSANIPDLWLSDEELLEKGLIQT